MTTFNIWHYFILGIVFLFFITGIVLSIKQSNKKLIIPMIFSTLLISILLSGLSIIIIDKYTKVVKLYKVKNKRLLSLEKITYTGMIKNEGNHKIGKVTLEIKLINKGHRAGKTKAGSFFSPSGFFNFFSGGANVLYKPQIIIKEFVVAKNLAAGKSKLFRVYFNYPPYFRNTSQFISVSGH